MRVTLQGRLSQLQKAIRDHSAEVAESQIQITTGRRVLKPSDDPSAVRQAMFHRARRIQLDQFISNAELAQIDVDAAEGILNQFTDRLNRAVEIGIQMSDGTANRSAMEAGAAELDALIDELLDLANTEFRGRFIFAGDNVLERPFSREGDQILYSGTDEAIVRRIRPGLPEVRTTFPGRGIFFQETAEPNEAGQAAVQDGIFVRLIELKNTMASGNKESLMGHVEAVREAIDRIVQVRVGLGAQSEAIGTIREQMLAERVEVENIRSQFEDADLAQVISDLQLRQIALQATLGVTANMVPVTLLDFLFG